MDRPVAVRIVAGGDDALRLYKRVRCAARALGIEVIIDEQRGGDSPRLFVDSRLLLEGLQRTEAIEDALARWLAERKG